MQKDFQSFLSYLNQACNRMIDHHYFQIELFGEDRPIFRERTYCYELYHQLRNVIPDNFHYKLDGELDKNGHPIFRGRRIPDFIVHNPGTMRNLVVIEVKPVTRVINLNELERDIDTFREFLSVRDGYYRAISLIYGDGQIEFPNELIPWFENEIADLGDRTIIVWHPGPGEGISTIWEL